MMKSEVNITIAGPQGSGKSLLAQAIMIDLQNRGIPCTVHEDDQGSDRRKPSTPPTIKILTGERFYTQAEVDSILKAAFPLATVPERQAFLEPRP